jgi:hypothetical protein
LLLFYFCGNQMRGSVCHNVCCYFIFVEIKCEVVFVIMFVNEITSQLPLFATYRVFTVHNIQYTIYSKDEISCEQRQLTCDFVKHRRNRMHQTKIKIMFVVILFLWKSNAKVISILAGLGECTIKTAEFQLVLTAFPVSSFTKKYPKTVAVMLILSSCPFINFSSSSLCTYSVKSWFVVPLKCSIKMGHWKGYLWRPKLILCNFPIEFSADILPVVLCISVRCLWFKLTSVACNESWYTLCSLNLSWLFCINLMTKLKSTGDVTSCFRPHRVEDGLHKCLPNIEVCKSQHTGLFAGSSKLWV